MICFLLESIQIWDPIRSLKFSGFEGKENESKVKKSASMMLSELYQERLECSHRRETERKRTHRSGPKIKKNGKTRDLEGRRMGTGKFIGSNLVILCYKEFEKFALCKCVSQLKFTFIVCSEPIESGYVKINFS